MWADSPLVDINQGEYYFKNKRGENQSSLFGNGALGEMAAKMLDHCEFCTFTHSKGYLNDLCEWTENVKPNTNLCTDQLSASSRRSLRLLSSKISFQYIQAVTGWIWLSGRSLQADFVILWKWLWNSIFLSMFVFCCPVLQVESCQHCQTCVGLQCSARLGDQTWMQGIPF